MSLCAAEFPALASAHWPRKESMRPSGRGACFLLPWESEGSGAMTWTIQNLQRMMCGLRGHDAILHFERNRLSMRCLSCGYETAGWTFESDTRRAGRSANAVSRASMSGFGRLHGIFEARASL